MKFFVVLSIFVFVFASVEAQTRKDRDRSGYKRIEELERIKLIEALSMDEETTLRFFARRNEHREEMHKLYQQSDELLETIDAVLKSDSKSKDEAELKKLLDLYLSNEKRKQEEKRSFLLSLHEILATDQVLRFVIFEKKFREEMRRILWKERRKH